jgi:hypothetical protein
VASYCAEEETHELQFVWRRERSASFNFAHRLRRLATVCPADAQVTETVLYAFLRGSDGGIVYAPVIADLSGPSGAPRGSTERPATAVFWRIAAGKVAALCSS